MEGLQRKKPASNLQKQRNCENQHAWHSITGTCLFSCSANSLSSFLPSLQILHLLSSKIKYAPGHIKFFSSPYHFIHRNLLIGGPSPRAILVKEIRHGPQPPIPANMLPFQWLSLQISLVIPCTNVVNRRGTGSNAMPLKVPSSCR